MNFQRGASVVVCCGLLVALGCQHLFADPLDQWTERHEFPFDYTSYAVAANESVVLAAGNYGETAYSFNGSNWNYYATNLPLRVHGMAYGRNLFVAVGGLSDFIGKPTIATSVNGVQWTNRFTSAASGSDVTFRAVTCGPDKFVAVGALGTIVTSSNAMDWTASSSGTTATLTSIAYANNKYIAGTDTGYILLSADGEIWGALSRISSNSIAGLAYGNGLVVAVTSDPRFPSTNTFLISQDGTNWTQSYVAPTRPRAVIFSGGIFVAVGVSSIYTSTNGIHWTTRPLNPTYSLHAVTRFRDTFVAVGRDEIVLQSGSLLKVAAMAGVPVQIRIEGATGGTYSIEKSGNLDGPNSWQTLTNFTLPATSYTWTDQSASQVGNGFYRVAFGP